MITKVKGYKKKRELLEKKNYEPSSIMIKFKSYEISWELENMKYF